MSSRRRIRLDRKTTTDTSNNSIYKHTHTTPTHNSIGPKHTGNTTPCVDEMTRCIGCTRPEFVEEIMGEYFTGPEKAFTIMPAPELHQVVLSWHSHDAQKLRDAFAEEFGRPMSTPRGYAFVNGVFLSKYNICFWHTVRFNATNEILKGIQNIIDSDRCVLGAVRLQRVEVAWNIPFLHLTREKMVELVRKLAAHMLPCFSHARVYHKWGNSLFNHDGTENGNLTVYFQKRRRNRNGQDVWVKKPAWKPKIYAKRIDGVWNLHIEVTMEKRYLQENDIALEIPETISPDWLMFFPLDKFLGFASFCRKRLVVAISGTDAFKVWQQKQMNIKRRYKPLHPCQVLLAAARDLPASEQKWLAITMAKRMGARRLIERIKHGEFDCPYYPFEE